MSTLEEKTLEFATLIGKLDIFDFMGLCKIMCIPVTKIGKSNDLRDFDEVCSDLIDRFITLNRHQRKEIIKILKDVAKANKK